VPGGSTGMATLPFSNDSLFRADFTSPVSMVSVDLGDFGADADNLLLQAFNPSDALIASDADSLAAGEEIMRTLSVSAGGISYVLFGSSLTDAFPNSVFVDNLTYTTPHPVPLPAGGVLLVSALAAFGFAGSRRR
jgi:hypothetical protein